MSSHSHGEAEVFPLEDVYGYDTREDSLAMEGEAAGAWVGYRARRLPRGGVCLSVRVRPAKLSRGLGE